MHEISTIGIDIAKHVFQIHGVDGAAGSFWAGARSQQHMPHNNCSNLGLPIAVVGHPDAVFDVDALAAAELPQVLTLLRDGSVNLRLRRNVFLVLLRNAIVEPRRRVSVGDAIARVFLRRRHPSRTTRIMALLRHLLSLRQSRFRSVQIGVRVVGIGATHRPSAGFETVFAVGWLPSWRRLRKSGHGKKKSTSEQKDGAH